MDQGLFAKHIRNLQERNNTKHDIIQTIQERTGIILEESELVVQKKQIRIRTSSVKKAALIQKGVSQVIFELGYTLTT